MPEHVYNLGNTLAKGRCTGRTKEEKQCSSGLMGVRGSRSVVLALAPFLPKGSLPSTPHRLPATSSLNLYGCSAPGGFSHFL